MGFWVIWVGLIASTVVFGGMLSPFLGLNVIGKITGWEPASEVASYATAVFDGAVLALPSGLIASFLLRRRSGALTFPRQFATFGAFVLAGALVSLSLIVATLGWYSLVVHLAGLWTGSFRFNTTTLYVLFCILGPLAIVIACVALAKIPTRYSRI